MKTSIKVSAKGNGIIPTKKTNTIRISGRSVKDSAVGDFARAFYAKHGKVMSKLANE